MLTLTCHLVLATAVSDLSLTVPAVETGELIGYVEWAEFVIQESGAKFYMMRVCLTAQLDVVYFTHNGSQYSDLHEILYTGAVRAGAEVILNAQVSCVSSPCSSEASDSSRTSSASLFCERPTVHLSDGTVLETDMIIGADGQHSTVRLSVGEKQSKPKPTGTIMFSGIVPMSKILEDDILKTESVAYSWVYWLGPRRCFMGESSLLTRPHPSQSLNHVLGHPIVGFERASRLNKTDRHCSHWTRNMRCTYAGIMVNLMCQTTGPPTCQPNF